MLQIDPINPQFGTDIYLVLGRDRLGKFAIGKCPVGNNHRGEYSAWEKAQVGKISLG